MVKWRATGGRERRGKWRIRRGYDQVKNVGFVVGRQIHMLNKVEREKKR